ncbi:MAG: hypothetical protein H7308_13895 [Chthonomonadaceae bacterium]|nr:hypothetical protein [Chthonomonadaceae bacterium]
MLFFGYTFLMTALDRLRKQKRRAFHSRGITLVLLIAGIAYLSWGLPSRFVKPDVQLTTLP